MTLCLVGIESCLWQFGEVLVCLHSCERVIETFQIKLTEAIV